MISFWKTTFINSPEVQRQVVWSKEMVGYDSRKIAQNRMGVKRDFRLPPRIKFQTQDRKEPQHIGGRTDLPKFAIASNAAYQII